MEQTGAAIIARLGESAFDPAMQPTIVGREAHGGACQERTYRGVEAACLDAAGL